MRLLLLCFFAVGLLHAQEKASLSGVLRDGDGAPIPEAQVTLSGPQREAVSSGADGSFRFAELDPGRYRLSARIPHPSAPQPVTLAPGQSVEDFDLTVEMPAGIRGRVLDENGEPMVGVRVYLVGGEYRYGGPRYTYRDLAETDDRGEYELKRATPGEPYVVLAKAHVERLPAWSDAPVDLETRRPAFRPTYYPRSTDLEAAERLTLRSGEVREGMDIRLSRTPSYCVSGVFEAAGAPAAVRFTLDDREPSSGVHQAGGFYATPPRGETEADGRFRICDLAPGEYRLTGMVWAGSEIVHAGFTAVTIVDRDVDEVVASTLAPVAVPVELLWRDEGPEEGGDQEITVWLRAAFRSSFREESTVKAAVPARETLTKMWLDDYEIFSPRLPASWYVARVEYGGKEVPHRLVTVGAAAPGSPLRVFLAHDGARVQVAVRDEDAEPVPGAEVFLLPEEPATEAALADSLLRGRADQNGVFVHEAVPLGAYRVLAVEGGVSQSIRAVRRLFLARPRAEELAVEAGTSVAVDVDVMTLR